MSKRNFQLIVGLGNPGKEYEMTRHNFGFLVVKKLASERGVTFHRDERFEAWRTHLQEPSCELLLPMTYMNESGRSVAKWLQYFRASSDAFLVVADDIDLPFGTMRIRISGSAAGHNGLRSIANYLGTKEFVRLRLGIGKDPQGKQVEHVLARFTDVEQKALPQLIQEAVQTINRLVTDDFDEVVAEINRKMSKSDAEKMQYEEK
jgi:PTH1 family peptidyl-tRNA hydrolase